jgi:hypothetical protein
MNPEVLKGLLSSLVRHGLTGLGAILVAHGLTTDSSWAVFAGGAVPIIVGLGWSYLSKWAAFRKIMIAVKMSPDSTIEDVNNKAAATLGSPV